MVSAIISYELSTIIEDKVKLTLKSADEVKALATKIPTFVKSDYEKVFVKVLAQYLGDNKSEEATQWLFRILNRIPESEIYKFPAVLFVVHDAVNKGPATVLLVATFLARFVNQSSEVFSYTVHHIFSDHTALTKIIEKVPAESVGPTLVKTFHIIVNELLQKGEAELAREITQVFVQAALVALTAKLTNTTIILRGIKRSIKQIAGRKELPLDLRKKFESGIKDALKTAVRKHLAKNRASIYEKIQRKSKAKMDSEWVKAVLVLYQLATGVY